MEKDNVILNIIFTMICIILIIVLSVFMITKFNKPKTVQEPIGFSFKVENKELHILEYTGTEANLVIPDTFNDMKIVEICDNAFKNNYTLKSVVIGKHITKIGNYAFANCNQLSSVTFNKKIKEIGDYAFSNCLIDKLNVDENSCEVSDTAITFNDLK